MKIRVGDQVKVIAGDGKGAVGVVMAVNVKRSSVTVEGVNLAYKHIRRSQKNPQGGRLSVELPVNVSNVAIFCRVCNAGVRATKIMGDDGSRVRLCRRCRTVV